MLQNFIDSVNVVLPIFLLISLGYILRKINFASERFYEDAEKFVFKIALPCQLFISVAFGSGGGEEVDYFRLVLFCVCGVTAAFLLSLIVVPLLIRDNGVRGAVIQNCYRSNFAILGIPLASAISPNGGSTAISVVMPFAIILFNVYTVIELNIFAPREVKLPLRKMIASTLKSIVTNPLIISVVLGLPFLIFGWKIPQELSFVEKTVEYLSDTTQAMILIALGAGFSFGALRGKLKYSLSSALYKIVVLPVVAVAAAHFLFGFSDVELVIIFVLFGAPPAVSSYIMAKTMKSDAEVASQSLLLATVLCVITLFVGVFGMKTVGWI